MQEYYMGIIALIARNFMPRIMTLRTYIDDNLVTIFNPYKTPYAAKILIPDCK